jgi:hypothetical protein
LITISIPNEKIFKKMLKWRDKNKDTVRQLDFNGIVEGIIEFKGKYKQHFVVAQGKVFLEVIGGGIDIRFFYDPNTWGVVELSKKLPSDFDYDSDKAVQDILTTYATSMALIKENYGVVRKDSGDYVVVM